MKMVGTGTRMLGNKEEQLMKLLTFTILMLLSLPILMPEPLSTLEVGKGTGEKVEAPVELPMKPQSIPYD